MLLTQLNQSATFISLVLSMIFLFTSAYLIYRFWPKTKQFFLDKNSRSDIHWFIAGVFISFLGAWADNFYWLLAWTSDYLNLSYKESLFQNGVYANIPFRQISGLLAVFCHLKGLSETTKNLKSLISFGCISGALFGACLVFFKVF